MEVFVEVHKITKCAIYSTVSLRSGEDVDGVLVTLSLIEQIVKDVNFKCISFGVNIHKYFRNRG